MTIQTSATTAATSANPEIPGARPAQPENVGVVVIHGVGEAEVGWINDYIVAELQKREPTMGLDPYSQVYRLPDKGRTKPGAMFRTVVRRARIADRVNVLFSELHWADLSRVGQGAFMRMTTVLKLFFEAPQVLGTSFLNQSSSGVHSWIRWLILTALWLLRWPIAGMSLSLFASAFGVMLVKYLEAGYFGVPLQHLVMGMLAATAVVGYLFARWRVNHDIALTDLGLSMALFASLMLAAVAIAGVFLAPEIMDNPAVYLATAGNSIIYLWIAWNFATIGAIALMAAIWLKRLIAGSRLRRYVPLDRPANAVALAIVQGTIWKLIICPVSLAIIYFLVADVEKGGCVPPDIWNQSAAAWADNTVKIIAVKMVLVSVLNLGMTLIAFAAIGVVVLRRRMAVDGKRSLLMNGRAELPRMIVSPLIPVSLFVGLLLNVTLYYGYLQNDADFCGLRSWLAGDRYVHEELAWMISGGCTLLGRNCLDQLRTITTSTVVFTVLPYFIGVVQKASSGVVHVARDIVDHQFTPRFEVARAMLPGVRPRGSYPRRERIQKRLDALMEGIIGIEPIDRLVFVTHSQGTVIMHDYLRSVRDDKALANIKRVDVVTLASPLTHIYQHYFRAYEVQSGSAFALNPKLASWTNLWRIDDPIGNRVDIVLDGFVRNEPLPKGGHVNYWKEERVCEVILDLLDPAPKAAAEAAAEATRKAAATRPGRVVHQTS